MSFGIPVRNGLSVSLVSSTFLSSGRRLNPALNLDFLTGGPLDPRITFSRTSQATLVDSTGKLTYAPNNSVLWSESFENASWDKVGSGVALAPTVTANAGAAPDGTTTADRIQFNCVNNTVVGNRSYVSPLTSLTSTTGAQFVASVWVKAYDAGNVGKTIRFACDAIGSLVYTLTDSWQRIKINGTSIFATTNFLIETRGTFTTQTADVLIWGAQLEQVTYQTTPGTYNSTSPKNLLGYTQEFDNAAWTKSNAFVQTNLLTYSEAFDNAAWVTGLPSPAPVTANTFAAPDGTTTADTIAPALATPSRRNQSSVTSGATYTASIWVRAAPSSSATHFRITSNNTVAWNTGASTKVALTTSWQRVSVTWTQSGSSLANIVIGASDVAGVNDADCYGNVLVWGAQLVQGSTAGDYQRTDAAAAAVQYVAPDGSRTADKLVETTATNIHAASQSLTLTAAPHSFSVYAKAGERSWVQVNNGSVGNCYAYFDLANGVVGTVGAGATATITAVGGGVYRCAINFTAAAGGNALGYYLSQSGSSISYTGDGTSGIYIWGAQLSNSASLDPYVYNPVAAPTSAAYYGPRFDYDPVTLANKGLLIEEQRTNLVTYSQQFDDASWAKSNTTVTANAIISPDGTTVADALVEDTATAAHSVYRSGGTLTGAYATSCYVKAAGRTWCYMEPLGNSATRTYFNLSGNGSVGTTGTGVTASITAVGNGWFRIVTVYTYAAAAAFVVVGAATGDAVASYAGNGAAALYLYGAQLEAGSFATSYIPTVASQVTRTADVALMQGANFSNWYNQNEGTFNSEFSFIYTGSRAGSTGILNFDSSGNKLIIYTAGGGNNASSYDGALAISAGVITSGGIQKVASAYNSSGRAITANAGPVTTGTVTASYSTSTSLVIGGSGLGINWINGHIRRIGYYNTRLSNTALVSLTAPNIIPSLSLDFTTQVFNVG